MIAGMNCANLKSLLCFTHSLQLIIKDGVLTQTAVQQLLSTARSLVGHYHRSNPAFQTFAKFNLHLIYQNMCSSKMSVPGGIVLITC